MAQSSNDEPPKQISRSAGEIRPHKIVKKSREKKGVKILELNAVTSLGGAESDERDKRIQGIVIDGRTYTCATCKTGHRVGVCKHGKDRPMKATHPPGRPPAGETKKVKCDCPKQCSCDKSNCKCARKCNCTQPMFMLVYVPAPDEEENAEEEKGSWKLGEQVMTDLKGNILTPEQVKERKEMKEAQKSQPLSEPRTRISSNTTKESPNRSTPVEAQDQEEPKGNCCKHKEAVATRNQAAQAENSLTTVPKSAAEGCNCGHTCACAFCPQHPNNTTSLNVARQQAMHFANHSYLNDQAIVPFLPANPQGMSCMGGQPRFAISRHPMGPSYNELRQAFPEPGYVIGYPIWSNRTDSAGYSMAPFAYAPTQNPDFMPAFDMSTMSNVQPHLNTPALSITTPYDFSSEEFGIGNAFVASAGPGGWDPNLMPGEYWANDATATSVPRSTFAGHANYLTSPEFQATPVMETPSLGVTPSALAEGQQNLQDRFIQQFDLPGTVIDNILAAQIPAAMNSINSCCQDASTTNEVPEFYEQQSPNRFLSQPRFNDFG